MSMVSRHRYGWWPRLPEQRICAVSRAPLPRVVLHTPEGEWKTAVELLPAAPAASPRAETSTALPAPRLEGQERPLIKLARRFESEVGE